MVLPVEHGGPVAVQPLGEEAAEGDAGGRKVPAVAPQEDHGDVERPGGVAPVGVVVEAGLEDEGEQAAAGPVGLFPDRHPVALPPRFPAIDHRRVGAQRGDGRLNRQRHPQLLGHVPLAAEVEGGLDRAGHRHHVGSQPSARLEEGAHHRVAALGHPGHAGRAPPWPVAGGEQLDAQPGADRPALVMVPVQLAGHAVDVREGAAGELELPARLDRDGQPGPLGGDDAPVLEEGLVAVLGEAPQHLGDAPRAVVWDGLQGAGAQADLLVLQSDLPAGSRALPLAKVAGQVVEAGDQRALLHL